MLPALSGNAPSVGAVARHYGDLPLSGFVVERGDEAGAFHGALLPTSTVMQSREDRARLAREGVGLRRDTPT